MRKTKSESDSKASRREERSADSAVGAFPALDCPAVGGIHRVLGESKAKRGARSTATPGHHPCDIAAGGVSIPGPNAEGLRIAHANVKSHVKSVRQMRHVVKGASNAAIQGLNEEGVRIAHQNVQRHCKSVRQMRQVAAKASSATAIQGFNEEGVRLAHQNVQSHVRRCRQERLGDSGELAGSMSQENSQTEETSRSSLTAGEVAFIMGLQAEMLSSMTVSNVPVTVPEGDSTRESNSLQNRSAVDEELVDIMEQPPTRNDHLQNERAVDEEAAPFDVMEQAPPRYDNDEEITEVLVVANLVTEPSSRNLPLTEQVDAEHEKKALADNRGKKTIRVARVLFLAGILLLAGIILVVILVSEKECEPTVVYADNETATNVTESPTEEPTLVSFLLL